MWRQGQDYRATRALTRRSESAGDGIAPIAREGAPADAYTGWRLAALVLVAIHHRCHPPHGLGIEAGGDNRLRRLVALDVAFQDRVENLVRRQRIGVLLIGRELGLSFSAAIWIQAGYLLAYALVLIPAARLSDRGVGYGIAAATVDGNDPDAMADALEAAVARARSGAGPTLIEAELGRMRGHSEADDSLKVVPPNELAAYLAADPVPSYAERLEADQILDAKTR